MTDHQDVEANLNPNYSGKINLLNDFYAYVDESGDEGFDFEKSGVSKWFNVSAIITTPQVTTQMIERVSNYRSDRCIQKNLAKMSMKDLKHGQRKDLLFALSNFKFVTTHSLFYKPRIDPKDRLVTYPSMYFVGVKNVIERITWCTKQYRKTRAHILISNRNSIRAEKLKEYLFDYSIRANANLAYQEKIGIVKLSNVNLNEQLLLADYAAFSLRMAFEETGNPPCPEPYYFKWFQKGRLFSSNYQGYDGIWGNGLKLTPSDRELITKSDILNEGSHKL